MKAKTKGFLVYLIFQIWMIVIAMRDSSLGIVAPIYVVWYILTPLIMGFSVMLFFTPVNIELEMDEK